MPMPLNAGEVAELPRRARRAPRLSASGWSWLLLAIGTAGVVVCFYAWVIR